MNSRWTRAGVALGLAALTLGGCSDKAPPQRRTAASAAEQTQQDAEMLARELTDIVDRVMAYRSAHRGNLPASFRQAGLDSLTPDFVRRLARQGESPLVTIAFRRTADRRVASCSGTDLILEEAMLHGGVYGVDCVLTGGGTERFTIAPPSGQ